MKIPAFMFFPADWRKDLAVQSLSFHDRGVWIEMLCLMHESESRGKLVVGGKPMNNDTLARLLGVDGQSLSATVKRILASGAASICPETNALMNRRMVRDEGLRHVRQRAGKRGGSPLLKQMVNPLTNQNPVIENEVGLVSGKRLFTDAWMDAYKSQTGEVYAFNGPKDGLAADRLLSHGILIPKLIEIAVSAWRHPHLFNCKHAASLSGFAARFNEIRAELKNADTAPLDAATRRQHNDELNRVLQRITTLRATYSDNQTWDQKDRERLRELRARERELKSLLGVKD